MEKTRFRGLSLSRLMLGTVQLGVDYGIANRAGRPSYQAARDIIAAAWAGGVNCFDTAAAYGESEAVLGRAFAELGLAGRPVVVSKVRHLPPGLAPEEAAAAVRDSVRQSLARLRLGVLPLCLFHREDNGAYLPALRRLRDEGLVGAAGVSLYRPGVAPALLRGGADALQVPASILDQRFLRSGVLEAAAASGAAVFARSVYLQGLLFLPEPAVPAALGVLLPVRRRLGQIAAAAGISLAEMAVRYVLGLPGVTCALAGVESVAQVRENLALFARGPLDPALGEEIERAVPDLPDEVLMPHLWPK